jgi:hypothetical protein
MNTLKKITSYTTIPNHFKGAIAKLDLESSGRVDVVFYVGKKSVGVEVAGFVSFREWIFNPKNEKEKTNNDAFVLRYIVPLHNGPFIYSEITNSQK